MPTLRPTALQYSLYIALLGEEGLLDALQCHAEGWVKKLLLDILTLFDNNGELEHQDLTKLT